MVSTKQFILQVKQEALRMISLNTVLLTRNWTMCMVRSMEVKNGHATLNHTKPRPEV